MAKISRTESNLFSMPRGSYLRNKSYVYVNTSNKYVPSSEKKDGGRGYTGHESVCIGVIQNPDNPEIRKFYANARYHELFLAEELPDPPSFADSLSVGLHCWIAEVSTQCGLAEDLAFSFGEGAAALILDLCAYMLSRESAVMQHVPFWARDHVLFSEDVPDDTYLGRFLKSSLSIPKIALFREKWAVRNIGDGKVYLCYDSTNVNSQADGVFIVQKGHAKDDPSLYQVNTDYVVRQSDGLPLTYLHSPGSVTDIAQAQEMIQFMDGLKKSAGVESVSLCLICDRGYISGKNLRHMDNAGIGYILMLRTTFGLYDQLAESVIDRIKSYKYELRTTDGDERYGITHECTLYEDGPTCYAQIMWSNERYLSKRGEAANTIRAEREKLEAFIAASEGKSFLPEALKWVPSYFKLVTTPGVPITEERKKRGRGKGTKTVILETITVTGYEDDETAINRFYQKAGIVILVTSDRLTAQETVEAYSKRDCVEKTFQALKSHLGMDKIGVTTEEAMHGKGLVWFVASILHALMFSKTAPLRLTDRKHYTVPAMIEELEAIKADKDLKNNNRKRRYKLTRRQQNILKGWGIDEAYIDEKIADLSI
jgi:transposase